MRPIQAHTLAEPPLPPDSTHKNKSKPYKLKTKNCCLKHINVRVSPKRISSVFAAGLQAQKLWDSVNRTCSPLYIISCPTGLLEKPQNFCNVGSLKSFNISPLS